MKTTAIFFSIVSVIMAVQLAKSKDGSFVAQPRKKHTATVIFVHGLGDTGEGWCDSMDDLQLPHVKFICPNAPRQKVTLNGGQRMPSWY